MLVVDTSVLIAHLKGSREATALLSGRTGHDELVVPSLAAWELWRGAGAPQARQKVDTLLESVSVEGFSPAMARIAADLQIAAVRAGKERPVLDLLIASHAIFHGAPLATADRSFAAIDEIEIVWIKTR